MTARWNGSPAIGSLLDEVGAGAPDFVKAFAHAPGTRVHFGQGAVRCAGELARESGARRVLVVTDPGIEAAGHLDKVVGSLEAAGIESELFDGVIENPTTETVAACVERARRGGIDAIVGLGGGSSMDTAKGCNFILTNGGRMQDYWGIGKATKPMLPLIVIPTTAGTGSECQSFALITDPVTHQKMACGDRKAAALQAILDPELTLTQPPRVTAVTGIDALAHAIESAVCRKRTGISLAYSKASFRLLIAGFPMVLNDPADIHARSMMQIGAALAGVAIENAMLGAAHSAANPLTAHFNVVHGVAVGLMLPHVIELNSQDEATSAIYRELLPSGSLAGRVRQLLLAAELPGRLPECGVTRDALPGLATEAAAQWTAQFNPVTVDKGAFLQLYERAWG